MSILAIYPDPLHSFPSLAFFFHLDQGGLVCPSVSVIAKGEELYQLLCQLYLSLAHATELVPR